MPHSDRPYALPKKCTSVHLFVKKRSPESPRPATASRGDPATLPGVPKAALIQWVRGFSCPADSMPQRHHSGRWYTQGHLQDYG